MKHLSRSRSHTQTLVLAALLASVQLHGIPTTRITNYDPQAGTAAILEVDATSPRRLQTDAQSYAELKFPQGSSVILGPATVVELQEQQGQVTLLLMQGHLRVIDSSQSDQPLRMVSGAASVTVDQAGALIGRSRQGTLFAALMWGQSLEMQAEGRQQVVNRAGYAVSYASGELTAPQVWQTQDFAQALTRTIPAENLSIHLVTLPLSAATANLTAAPAYSVAKGSGDEAATDSAFGEGQAFADIDDTALPAEVNVDPVVVDPVVPPREVDLAFNFGGGLAAVNHFPVAAAEPASVATGDEFQEPAATTVAHLRVVQNPQADAFDDIQDQDGYADYSAANPDQPGAYPSDFSSVYQGLEWTNTDIEATTGILYASIGYLDPVNTFTDANLFFSFAIPDGFESNKVKAFNSGQGELRATGSASGTFSGRYYVADNAFDFIFIDFQQDVESSDATRGFAFGANPEAEAPAFAHMPSGVVRYRVLDGLADVTSERDLVEAAQDLPESVNSVFRAPATLSEGSFAATDLFIAKGNEVAPVFLRADFQPLGNRSSISLAVGEVITEGEVEMVSGHLVGSYRQSQQATSTHLAVPIGTYGTGYNPGDAHFFAGNPQIDTSVEDGESAGVGFLVLGTTHPDGPQISPDSTAVLTETALDGSTSAYRWQRLAVGVEQSQPETETSRNLTGYAAGVGEVVTNGSVLLTALRGDVSIATQPDAHRLEADYTMQTVSLGGGEALADGEASVKMGGDAGASAYIDGQLYGATTSNQQAGVVVATEAFADQIDLDSATEAVEPLPELAHVQWGFWFGDFVRGDAEERVNLGYLVAGEKTLSTALPKDGAATYQGGLMGTVYDEAGGARLREVNGTYVSNWDFAAGRGQTEAHYDNATYTGNLNSLSDTAQLQGTLPGADRIMQMEGAFYGPAAEEMAGRFSIQEAHEQVPVYRAEGVFIGQEAAE